LLSVCPQYHEVSSVLPHWRQLLFNDHLSPLIGSCPAVPITFAPKTWASWLTGCGWTWYHAVETREAPLWKFTIDPKTPRAGSGQYSHVSHVRNTHHTQKKLRTRLTSHRGYWVLLDAGQNQRAGHVTSQETQPASLAARILANCLVHWLPMGLPLCFTL